MTLVTNLILRTIWAETRGTDDARAKQLVDIAKTRGVPANDLALGRVVDLVQRRQFSRVAAMFADAPSSTRPHDVATQGMRAGGFASVHELSEPQKMATGTPAATSRRAPRGLFGGTGLFEMPYQLSEEQRDWITGARAKKPPAAPLSNGIGLEVFAENFKHLSTTVWLLRAGRAAEVRMHDPDTRAIERCLECALDNISSPRTVDNIEALAKSPRFAEQLAAQRGLRDLELITRGVNADKMPELAEIPLSRVAGAIALADMSAPLRANMDSAIANGRLDITGALARALRRVGSTSEDPVVYGAASLVQARAYAAAANRLNDARLGTPLGNLRAALRQPTPRVDAQTLAALERDGHKVLADALRDNGVAGPDGSVALAAARIRRNANDLIKAGQKLLTPELLAATNELRRLELARRQEKPPSAETSVATGAAMGVAMKEMDKLFAAAFPYNSDEQTAYSVLADTVHMTDAAVSSYSGLHYYLRRALWLTDGRGIACLDRLDATGDTSEAIVKTGTINLVALLKSPGAVNPGEDVFHELGHLAEHSDPELRAACTELRDRRGAGKARVSLRTLGIQDDAMAVDGGFITGYAGKIIPSGSTEMMSVGFQHFASTYSAARLCAHDVEHFCLVLGWLTS